MTALSVSIIPLCFFSMAAHAADIIVLAPGNSKEAITEIGSKFEASTGNKIKYVFAGGAAMQQKLNAGEKFDVLINNAVPMTRSKGDGTVMESKAFSSVAAVLVYRKGATKPDVTTLEGFKKVVDAAPSISHSDFRLGGGSAAFYQANLRALGIEKEAESKAVLTETGQGALPANDGRAVIGIAQSSEVVGLANVESTRLLPSDPKGMTAYDVAISSKSDNVAAARGFLEFLTRTDTKASLIRWGYVAQ